MKEEEKHKNLQVKCFCCPCDLGERAIVYKQNDKTFLGDWAFAIHTKDRQGQGRTGFQKLLPQHLGKSGLVCQKT